MSATYFPTIGFLRVALLSVLLFLPASVFCASFFAYPEKEKGTYITPIDPVENIDMTDIATMEFLRSSSYLTLYDDSIWPKTVDPTALEQPIGMILGTKFARAPHPYYAMPISFIKTTIGGANSHTIRMPNQEGVQSDDIFFVTQWGGRMLLADRALFHWEFEHYFSPQGSENKLHKLYVKYKIGKLAFEGGMDNLKLGPGAYGMLLDNNTDPYWMVKLQTERSLLGGGYWNFVLMHGWLREKRDDYSNPGLMAARLTWRMPGVMNFIRLGASHTLLYGGDGRENIHPYELPWLFFGVTDNEPETKYDADSYGAVDLTIYVPVHRWIPSIRFFSIYFQEGGTDIKGIWQKEDAGDIVFPYLLFRFYEREYIIGMSLGLKHHVFRLEYSKNAKTFYQHHMYRAAGYTYNDMSLGDPQGNNFQRMLFRHSWIPDKRFSVVYEIGYYQGPAHDKTDHHQKCFATSPVFSTGNNIFHRGYLWADMKYSFYPFRLGFQGKIDGGDGHDANPRPAYTVFSSKPTFNFMTALSLDVIF